MLKKPSASFSAHRNPQRIPEGNASGFDSPAALLAGLFEHPAKSDSLEE
jgi:hypothetical protein